MTVKITKILTTDEFIQLNDDAVAKGFYRNDRKILTPGMAWEMAWVYDPSGQRQAAGKNVMISSPDAANKTHLSIHYWKDWAHIRPPICVVCPNFELWEIDRKSSNGEGWVVTNPGPLMTCHPSIVVPGYHGWLKNGEFSPDIENRGPIGVVRTF